MALVHAKLSALAFSHDIGKSVDQDSEGDHASLGAALCEKHGESTEVCEAVQLHHSDELVNVTPLAVIVNSANALSANRPAARNDQLSKYITRLEELENIVTQMKGIEHAYVLQAGREVRAMVQPDGTTDDDVEALTNEIASKLRKELTFPGQVRITVLRENKFVEYAT